jgi:cell division GTPase FtsZ
MKLAEKGIQELQQYVDTLLIIPNQNLFRIANEKTTFADAFKMADDVLYAGVRGVTDLMVQPGLINLDFSDVKTVMSEMGKAMMGTGEAAGEGRAIAAAEAAIANPLIDDVSLKGARGLIINITGGKDITLYEVDEAANRIKQEVDESANIIYGTTCDDRLEGVIRVSIVATGIDVSEITSSKPKEIPAILSIDNSVYQQKTSSIHNNVLGDEMYTEQITDKINNETDYSNEESINKNPSKPEEKETNSYNDEAIELLKEPEPEENLEFSQNTYTESDDKIEHLEDNVENSKEIKLENQGDDASSDTSTTVRRLSLFDTMNDEATQDRVDNKVNENPKKEPILEDKNEPEEDYKENDSEDFSSEEELEDLSEEDFNQETEEELLDIPTFLRRQAN